MKKVVNVMRYISDAIGALFLLIASMIFYTVATAILFICLIAVCPVISIWWAISIKEPVSETFIKVVGGYLSLIRNGLNYVEKNLES